MLSVKQQLEQDSYKRNARLSPAQRLNIALEISSLCFELSDKVKENKRNARPQKNSKNSSKNKMQK